MSQINGLGIGGRKKLSQEGSHQQYVFTQRPLQRLLAFRGHSIDDVVNNPIVKNDVAGYWRVFKLIERRSEALELERQWNHLGQRI